MAEDRIRAEASDTSFAIDMPPRTAPPADAGDFVEHWIFEPMRLGFGFAASIAVHIVLLSVLAVAVRRTRSPQAANAVEVRLLRLPPVRPSAPNSITPPSSQLRARQSSTAPNLPSPPATLSIPPVVAPDEPMPATREAAPVVRPRLSLGCLRPPELLSPEERARCELRALPASDLGPASSLRILPPDKQQAYDEVLSRRRRPPSPPIVPCTGPGSNIDFGCIPH